MGHGEGKIDGVSCPILPFEEDCRLLIGEGLSDMTVFSGAGVRKIPPIHVISS